MNIALPVGLFLTFFNASLTWSTIAFPVIIFTVNAMGVPMGRLICKLFHQNNRFLPFAMTTSEDGMVNSTAAGPLLADVCNFISAPTNAAILIVIGYRILLIIYLHIHLAHRGRVYCYDMLYRNCLIELGE